MIGLYYTVVFLVVVGLLAEHYKKEIVQFYTKLKTEWANRPVKPKRPYAAFVEHEAEDYSMWKHFEEIKEMYKAKDKKEKPKKINPLQEQILRNARGQTIRRRPRGTSSFQTNETNRILKRLRENAKKPK